jgi:hypothetical protein
MANADRHWLDNPNGQCMRAGYKGELPPAEARQ